MSSLLERARAWLSGRRQQEAFYPDEEPQTRAERTDEMLGSAEHPLDEGFPSADYGRQQPSQ
jgi:hypothetical protein